MKSDQTTLARSILDTHGMDEQEARQAYFDRLDGLLATEFLEPFKAAIGAYTLGPLRVLAVSTTAHRTTRSTERIARDGYGSLGVHYVISGQASGDAAGRTLLGEPGTVMILDYARPFTLTYTQSSTIVSIAVPRSLLPTIRGGDWHGATPSDAATGLLAGFMKGLQTTLPALPAVTGPPLATAFVGLLTGMLIDERSPALVTPAEPLVRRAAHLVDTWIGSPELGPAWMAARLNVSRSELYAALERFGGVARFIMQRRLGGARAALEDPHDQRQIRGIAFAFGFSSEAQFSRAFRAHFAATASDVRRDVRIKSRAAPIEDGVPTRPALP